MSNDKLTALAAELGKLLAKQGRTLAVAESCTGGWIAQTLTEIPGSSTWFDRGFVTYSNQAKIDMLGVDQTTLDNFGAVSQETVAAMVAGALAYSQADYAIAVTGIAGPEGGTPDKPIGTVFIAWQKRGGKAVVEKNQFSGDRHEVRAQAVKTALEGGGLTDCHNKPFQ